MGLSYLNQVSCFSYFLSCPSFLSCSLSFPLNIFYFLSFFFSLSLLSFSLLSLQPRFVCDKTFSLTFDGSAACPVSVKNFFLKKSKWLGFAFELQTKTGGTIFQIEDFLSIGCSNYSLTVKNNSSSYSMVIFFLSLFCGDKEKKRRDAKQKSNHLKFCQN